jgi:peptidoglycan/LPS O-acetylase OafA/YrhL
MNGIDASSFPYYLSFTSNFDVLYNGLPDASVLGVLWSVAIEEQFYLFWPILFILFPKNKSIYPIIAVFIMSAVYRFTTDTYNEMEYHTLSSIGDMAVGGFAAYLIIFSTIFQEFFKNASKWIIISVYVLTIGFILWKDELCATSMFFFHVQRLIFASFIAFIILEQSFSLKSVFKLSRLKWISKLGKYTYGMYCFQFVGILIALRITQFAGFSDNLLKVLIIDTILALVITIFMSWLSYEYYEKRFLKLKTRFSKIDIKQNIVNEDPLQGN